MPDAGVATKDDIIIYIYIYIYILTYIYICINIYIYIYGKDSVSLEAKETAFEPKETA